MLSAHVKFTLNNFEYFLLTIQPKLEVAKIISKLENFVNLNQANKTIIIEIDGLFINEELISLLEKIKAFCKINKIIIHSIAKNEYTNELSIAEIDIINLPKNNIKSKLVYNKALLVNEPVRSGIKIENDGDIILTSFVSDNAEVIAGGNIHVYGEARGRLIAGCHGDKQARIFVIKFNPTLIAIAGIYRALEGNLPDNILHKAVQIFLDDKDRLNIVPF